MNKELLMKRITNPWFWIGVVATIITAAGIKPQELTSWNILANKILFVVQNPYILGLVIVALLGQWNNPTTNRKNFLDD